MRISEYKKEIYKKCNNNISAKDKLIADIASQIFEARLKRGLTQKELAKLIGSKQPAIARLEAGNNSRIPSNEMLYKISEALNTELVPPKFSFIDEGAIVIHANTKTEERKSVFGDEDMGTPSFNFPRALKIVSGGTTDD